MPCQRVPMYPEPVVEDFVYSAYLSLGDVCGDPDGDHWAWEAIHRLADADLDKGWSSVLQLIHLASDEQLGFLAADILEDVVKHYEGAAVERLEAECPTNPKLRRALSYAYLWTLPRPLFDRIEMAAGMPLHRPKVPKIPGQLPPD